MDKVKLFNNFHNTSVNVIPDSHGIISPATAARVRRELCGVAGCTCAQTGLRTRGSENPEIHPMSGDLAPAYRIWRD